MPCIYYSYLQNGSVSNFFVSAPLFVTNTLFRKFRDDVQLPRQLSVKKSIKIRYELSLGQENKNFLGEGTYVELVPQATM